MHRGRHARKRRDPAWLDRTAETAIDPQQPILHPHHHVFPQFDPPYGMGELQADVAGQHAVAATVDVEALTGWRADGPAHLRPVGETAFAATLGRPRTRRAVQGRRRRSSHGDFVRGAAVADAIEVHMEAGNVRLRGLRAHLFWDEGFELGIPMPTRELCASQAFHGGFSRLAPHGLAAEILAFSDNLPEIARLAADFADTPIVIDHCGCPLRCLDDSADGNPALLDGATISGRSPPARMFS